MTFNRNFKTNVLPLRALIYNTIGFCIAAFYFSKSERYDNLTTYLILSSIWLVILVIVCVLHIDYLFKAKTVEIDLPSKSITFDEHGPICFDQIERITLVIPPALYRNDPINVSPFDEYHYAEFLIKDGKRYFFTSLLSQNVEKEIDQIGIPIQVKKRLVAYTFL